MVTYQHGGDIYRNQVSLDYSVNVNPLGIPESVKQAFLDSVTELHHYPDSQSQQLRQRLAEHHKIPADHILCGNGCADLIFQLAIARKPRRAVVLAPTFSEYETALTSVGCNILHYYLKREDGLTLKVSALEQYLRTESAQAPIEMLFLCNPNNPTGQAIPAKELASLIITCKTLGIFLVIDECFNEFIEDYQNYSLIEQVRNKSHLLILKAFTKTYALAGLRLGYAICSNRSVLEQMSAARQPWSVSIPAGRAGIAALSAPNFLCQTRTFLKTERPYLSQKLENQGLNVYPSSANYLFFENPRESSFPLGDWCRQRGILIRSCANYHGLTEGDYRICIKTRTENQILLSVFQDYRAIYSG